MSDYNSVRNQLLQLRTSEVNKLTAIYNEKLKSINNDRLLNIKVKQQLIKTLTMNHNYTLSVIINKYNKLISRLNSQPQSTTIASNNFKSKKALLIGINYNNTPYKLNGCINDVENMKTHLVKKGFNESNICSLTDNTAQKPNRAIILSEFTKLLSNASSGDVIFFFYSGHGSNIIDNNNDENDKYDEAIVTLDYNLITDDMFKSVIDANLKEGVTLLAFFDACHSGTMLDLPYQYFDSELFEGNTVNNANKTTKGNVIMISGCRDVQTSEDAYINNMSQGAMTWSLLESLKTPSLTWAKLLQEMRNNLKKSNYTQIPQLSAGSSSFNINNPILL